MLDGYAALQRINRTADFGVSRIHVRSWPLGRFLC
jgi:hypothetical protein